MAAINNAEHLQIDPDETARLPGQERTQEDSPGGRPRRVKPGLRVCSRYRGLLVRLSWHGFHPALSLFRYERPTGPQSSLIQEHMVQENFDPVACKPDFAKRPIQVAPIFRITIVIRNDGKHRD